MTFHQLEYTLAIKKYGSFKHASEKLGISQPALSMQVQKLEDEIGIRIFDRNTSPTSVTRDGSLFMERAQEIVTATHRLTEFSSQLNDEYFGTIKIGIIPTLAPFLVPLFIDSLTKDFPGIRLDIHEIITEKVVNGVRSGELDAGIISTPLTVYGIEVFPLFYEKFYIYSSNDQLPQDVPINLNKINYENLWLLEEGNCFRDQINNFCDLNKIRKNKHIIYRSNSIDALIRMVDTKGGMTILPELCTLSLNEDQEENIKTISGKPKVREIAIIVTRNHDKERFITKIQEYIQKNIPKSMLSSKGVEIVDPEIIMDYNKNF